MSNYKNVMYDKQMSFHSFIYGPAQLHIPLLGRDIMSKFQAHLSLCDITVILMNSCPAMFCPVMV